MSGDELIPIECVVRGVDKDPADPVRSGDLVDGFTPVEPYAYQPRPSLRSWAVDPHSVPLPGDLERSRMIEQFYCDCAKRATLVRIIAGSDGRKWALMRPEQVPTAARRDGHDDGRNSRATPLHCSIDGTPCIQVTTCRRCRRNWLVLLWDDVAEIVKLNLVRHGLRVVDDRTP